MEASREIEWLKIDQTAENREIVLDILRRIHVPGEITNDAVCVYGYRADIAYIWWREKSEINYKFMLDKTDTVCYYIKVDTERR